MTSVVLDDDDDVSGDQCDRILRNFATMVNLKSPWAIFQRLSLAFGKYLSYFGHFS